MYPELAHWGFVHIRTYGLMLALAFLVGTWLGMREAKRLGLDEDRLVNVILIVLIASVLGARALYVLEQHEQTNERGQRQTVEEHESENSPFVTVPARGRARDNDALGVDHLAHHSP